QEGKNVTQPVAGEESGEEVGTRHPPAVQGTEHDRVHDQVPGTMRNGGLGNPALGQSLRDRGGLAIDTTEGVPGGGPGGTYGGTPAEQAFAHPGGKTGVGHRDHALFGGDDLDVGYTHPVTVVLEGTFVLGGGQGRTAELGVLHQCFTA